MKKLWMIFTMLALAPIARGATNDLTGLLQQGLFEEEANRNLDAAISNYQSLANAFDKDRQVAATAIFRLGECYRKLGQTNQAAAQYQRIVRDFSDQQTLATLSQQNLAGLGLSGQPAIRKQSSVNSEQVRELVLVKKLQAMPFSEVLQAGPTLLTDATLINLIYQYNQTELDLIRLRTDHGEDHPEVTKEKAIESALHDKIKERLEGLARALSLELGPAADSEGKSILSGESALMENSTITDEEEKEIRRIQELIRNSPDLINSRGAGESAGWTPLYQAAKEGWLRVATYLLDHGANVNKDSGPEEGTPLHAATRSGNKGMAELLLSRGADVNAGTQGLSRTSRGQAFRGLTPLHIAADKGFLSVAETLLDHKADVNARDGDGQTPLHQAASSGQVDMIKLLLAHGADINAKDKNDTTALSAAIHGNRAYASEAVGVLLAAKPDVNPVDGNGQTPLSIAAWNGSGSLVKALLDAKADPNVGTANLPLAGIIELDGYTDADRTNLTEQLLRAGADPNIVAPNHTQQNGNSASPIQLAVGHGRTDVVKMLLDYKANANAPAVWWRNKGMTLLMDASDKADTEIAKALLAHGAEVNARDTSGNTALFYAIWKGSPETVELLISNKADVNVQNNDGKTPLNIAKENEHKGQPGILANIPVPPNVPLPFPERVRALTAPRRPGAGPVQASVPALPEDVVKLLHEHGAVDELPNFDAIRVTREGLSAPILVFQRQSNDWNHYTLLETMMQAYSGYVLVGNQWLKAPSVLKFPNLRRIIIHRPNRTSLGKDKEITVDLLNSTNGIDCGKDVPVEFGDIVEIPIRDYSLGEEEVGLTQSQWNELKDCLKMTVRLVVRGESKELTPGVLSDVSNALQKPEAKSLLLASSDLAHVKVTRKDPSTGKTREFIVDATADHGWQDLRLENGDTIEVPEKAGE